MNLSAIKLTIMTVVGLGFLMGCVTQNEIASLDNRLSQLEFRNAEARKNSEKLKTGLQSRQEQERALRQQAASLRAKMDALDEEIRLLIGRVEEIEYLMKRRELEDAERKMSEFDQLDKLAKIIKSNDTRILRIEQYLNFEPTTQIGAATKAAVGKKAVPKQKPGVSVKQEPSEDEIYRMAKQAFDQGDSDVAREKFQELIKRYPKSDQADNAQFWIGEIYYREKWYEKAILEYQKVIENYPKGNKVPASLLKQGFAFINLGDKANARIILEELIKKYPKSNEAKIAGDKLKLLK